MMHSYGMMGVGEWGIIHWLILAACVALIAYPVGLILKRLGYSPLWAALTFVPFLDVIGLWLVALGERSRADGPA